MSFPMAIKPLIRFFKPEDAEHCSFLMQNHFRNYATNLSVEVRRQIADSRTTEYIQKIVTDRAIVVAVIDHKIVGMGGLKQNEIRHMYVSSEFQGKGVGSAILRFLEKEAYYNGFSSLIVNSVPHSEEFYKKNGFKPLINTQIERHGAKLDTILLEKLIE
ncbi:MAG: GNAT family N-acetyltransferase [Candidatus Heimdallarchaeota archaeon]|nr:MAG: GNAT family N-acetyltransferase [Candidatus Heimdallarchaeota archaeon]